MPSPRDAAAVVALLARIRPGPRVFVRALAFGRRANPPVRCACGGYGALLRCRRCARGALPG
jgi:hypothetical protein